MLRRLLNATTRLLGWSAVGKRVLLASGEGPVAAALTGRCGSIEDVSTDRSGQEVIRVVLDHAVVIDTTSTTEIRLVPRHAGCGSLALATTAIAAYVVRASESASDCIADAESILAVMDVRKARTGEHG